MYWKTNQESVLIDFFKNYTWNIFVLFKKNSHLQKYKHKIKSKFLWACLNAYTKKKSLRLVQWTDLGHWEPKTECINCARRTYTSSGKTHVIWKNSPIRATNAIASVDEMLFSKFCNNDNIKQELGNGLL